MKRNKNKTIKLDLPQEIACGGIRINTGDKGLMHIHLVID